MKLINRLMAWSGAVALSMTLATAAQAEPLYAHESHGWDRDYHRDFRPDFRDRHGHYHPEHYGRVIAVHPIYRTRHHNDYCYREQRRDDRGDRNRRALIGGVAGATLGNLIGREQGDATLGTVVGAVVGAVGVDALGRGSVRCETHRKARYDRAPVAYRVKYIYRGQIRMIQTRHYPGRFIRIDSGYRERG